MYVLEVTYFNEFSLCKLTYSFDKLKDIFEYIRDCINDEDIFEFRIYRQ